MKALNGGKPGILGKLGTVRSKHDLHKIVSAAYRPQAPKEDPNKKPRIARRLDPEETTTRLTCRIPNTQVDAVTGLAEALGVTRASIVRLCLSLALPQAAELIAEHGAPSKKITKPKYAKRTRGWPKGIVQPHHRDRQQKREAAENKTQADWDTLLG